MHSHRLRGKRIATWVGVGSPHNWGQMINENHRAPAATQEPKGPRNSESDAVRVKATSLQKMFIKIALINYEKNRWTAKSGTSFSGSLVSARSFFYIFPHFPIVVVAGQNNSNNESNRCDNRIELRCNNVSPTPNVESGPPEGDAFVRADF